jgi:hypothetical protein
VKQRRFAKDSFRVSDNVMCRFLCAGLLALTFALAVRAETESAEFAAVRTADQQRVAAVLAGDATALEKTLSAELRYALADGRVQTRDQYLAAVKSNGAKYASFESRDLHFTRVASGVVAVDGQAHFTVESNGRKVASSLHFLALWREELGAWRLLAYQSAQLLR